MATMATDPWPYVITVDQIKLALGLPPDPDPVLDPALERAIMMSQALVESYICGNILPTPHTHDEQPFRSCGTVYLPNYPLIEVSEVRVDANVQDPTTYRPSLRKGTV